MITVLFLIILVVSWTVQANITPQNFQTALDRLPSLCQDAIDSGGVPGLSIAVVYNDTVRFSRGFGLRREGGSDAVDEETVFQIASLSKPISSSIVSTIVTRGEIRWDSLVNSPETIAEYSDPWISQQVMLEDAFSHRTGLYGLAGDDLELFNYNRSTILSKLKYMAPTGPFRAAYSYSNYGLTLGAESAARATGKEWEDVSQEYLYGPVGMTSTTGRDSEFLSRTNRAALHAPRADVLLGSQRKRNNDGNSTETDWVETPHRNPDPQGPAGGISSNVVDLAKWVRLQLSLGINPASNERLISEATLVNSHTPRISRGNNPITNHTSFYALGMGVDYADGQVFLSHAGAFSQGARSLVKMDIATGLGIVVLANCFPTGWPEGITDTFWDLATFGEARRDYVTIWNEAYQALAGGFASPVFSGPRPANATSMLPARRYAGKYSNEYVGSIHISVGKAGSAGELTATFPGSSNASLALKHWNRDTFYFAPSQGDVSKTGVTFTIGADGTATDLTAELLNGNAGGVLKRHE